MGMPGMDPSMKWLFGGQSILSGMESSVQTFGRVSSLLQMNFEALYMSFMSAIRFIGNFVMLRHELIGIGQTFTTFRFLQIVYHKIKRFFSRIFSKNSAEAQLGAAWQEQEESAWVWVPFCLTLAVAFYIMRWIWRKIRVAMWGPYPLSPEEFQEQQKDAAAQQQYQQQAAQMNGGAGMMGGMGMMGGGYGMGMGGYGSSMYGGMGGYGSMYGGGGYGGSMYGMGSGYGSSLMGGSSLPVTGATTTTGTSTSASSSTPSSSAPPTTATKTA
eukprot:TRINITY_DN7606_c0_g1_i1.p1 TRINITY_DN7606_c0_g1~~TRINITY_DN7606_c0_g1_i1.p1  ORF type:complete len:271 (+),score=50.65 TRINITY_DN7606_c0_g1_i1:3-815(+)